MKKKGQFSNIILFVLFLAGLSLLLYPSLANYINSKHQTVAIAAYSEKVSAIEEDDCESYWQDAIRYNAAIPGRVNQFAPSEEELTQYYRLLDPSGNGIMGYIEIPAIDVTLPIYHGAEENVLQVGVGHLDWTSLPVGGEDTHCVLSGHRGLPRAKLFTHLDKLVEGDIFMLRVLDEVLTYEVDQILIVLPDESDELKIVPGADLCTLVTCTPYGINTHRLLVRGHRIETPEDVPTIRITADAIQVDPLLVAPVLIIPIIILAVVAVYLPKPGKGRRKGGEEV